MSNRLSTLEKPKNRLVGLEPTKPVQEEYILEPTYQAPTIADPQDLTPEAIDKFTLPLTKAPALPKYQPVELTESTLRNLPEVVRRRRAAGRSLDFFSNYLPKKPSLTKKLLQSPQQAIEYAKAIPDILKASRMYIEGEKDPYTGKPMRPKAGEIYDRFKNMLTRAFSPLAYLMPGVTRRGLVEELDRDAEEFTGFGPAVVPAAGRIAEASGEMIAFVKAFGATHALVERGKEIPKVARLLNAVKQTGGVRQFADKFPRIANASERVLQAFTEGEIIGQTYGFLESMDEGYDFPETIKTMNVRGALTGGIAGVFQLASTVDNVRYVNKLRAYLVKNTMARYEAKIQALPKGMADPKARALIYQGKMELQQIDNIVSATEAQLIGLKSGKLTRGAFEKAVENPQRAAERIIKYGYNPKKGYTVGQPKLKKGLGKPVRKPLLPTTRAGEIVEQAKEVAGAVKQVIRPSARPIMAVKSPEPSLAGRIPAKPTPITPTAVTGQIRAPEVKPAPAVPTEKQPWEMTKEERQAKIKQLKADNAEALGTPLMSEGGISPYEVGALSKRQKERYQKNAMRRMEIESQIKQLSKTDAELQAEQTAEKKKKASERLTQIRTQIRFLQDTGKGKRGIKPSYQKRIDELEAERKQLTRPTVPPKAEVNRLESLKEKPAEKPIKEIEHEEEAITEPTTSLEVEPKKAGEPVPEGTGQLDPTNYEDALEITRLHAKWVAYDKSRPTGEGIYSTKWDKEKLGYVKDTVDYAPEEVDTAYRIIQKSVPSPMPDTELFAMPGKEAQIQAIAQKMQKIKPVTRKAPKAVRLTKPAGLPKAKTEKADHIKAIYQATAKETTRYAINGVKVEGDTIIATDGRRMFWAKGNWGKDGLYLNQAFLKNGLLGKPTKKPDLKFPNWRDIVPDVSGEKPILVDDLETVWRRIRQATLITSEESRGITVIANKDGTLGFAAATPEAGHAEINIHIGGKILGGLNPNFLMDVLRFHATRGDKSFEFYFPHPDRPTLTRSLDGKTNTLTMPINIGEGEPSEAIKKAISEWPVAPKLKQPKEARELKKLGGVQQLPATVLQKARALEIAEEKGLINKKGKPTQNYRRFAKAMTGKTNIDKMGEEEANYFIDMLDSLTVGYRGMARIPTSKNIITKELADKIGKFKNIGALERARPAWRVFEKIGLTKEVFEPAFEAEISSVEELFAFREQAQKMQKLVGKGKSTSQKLFRALENPGTVKLGPEEEIVVKWGRKFFADWADRLRLPAESRREKYITHIFERDITQALKAKHPLDPDLAIALDFITPKTIFNPFLQHRLGKKVGLKEDFWAAIQAYEHKAIKKFYYEPLIQRIRVYEKFLPTNSARYLRNYITRITGRPLVIDREVNQTLKEVGEQISKLQGGKQLSQYLTKGNAAGMMAYNITGIYYECWLGLRPASAIKNLSQHGLILAETGPVAFAKALKVIGAERAELLANSKVLRSRKLGYLPGIDQTFIKGLESKRRKVTMAMFRAADRKNVSDAFLAGYYEAKANGLSNEWAYKRGDEVAAKTQWLYSKLAGSQLMQSSPGRVLGVLTTWPENWAELMNDWIQAKPSRVYTDYAKETGKEIPKVNWLKRRKSLWTYLALVSLAMLIHKKTPFKALYYTGWTSIGSLIDIASGKLAGLRIPTIILNLVGGLLMGDKKRIKQAWNEMKRFVVIAKELTDIITGKKDWLNLFVYTEKEKGKELGRQKPERPKRPGRPTRPTR